MADLSIEVHLWCSTNTGWSMKIKDYLVTWDRHSHKNHDVQFDYACTCKAYQFGKGKYCKHILEAKQHHCKWNHGAVMGDGVSEVPEDHKCPECGADLEAIRIGV